LYYNYKFDFLQVLFIINRKKYIIIQIIILKSIYIIKKIYYNLDNISRKW